MTRRIVKAKRKNTVLNATTSTDNVNSFSNYISQVEANETRPLEPTQIIKLSKNNNDIKNNISKLNQQFDKEISTFFIGKESESPNLKLDSPKASPATIESVSSTHVINQAITTNTITKSPTDDLVMELPSKKSAAQSLALNIAAFMIALPATAIICATFVLGVAASIYTAFKSSNKLDENAKDAELICNLVTLNVVPAFTLAFNGSKQLIRGGCGLFSHKNQPADDVSGGKIIYTQCMNSPS